MKTISIILGLSMIAILASCNSGKDDPEIPVNATVTASEFEKAKGVLWVRTDDKQAVLGNGEIRDVMDLSGHDGQNCNAFLIEGDKWSRFFVHQIDIGSELGSPYGRYDYSYTFNEKDGCIYLNHPSTGKQELWYRVESVGENDIILHRNIGADYFTEDFEYESPENYTRIRYTRASPEDELKYMSWELSEFYN